jgi:hypothetical protein
MGAVTARHFSPTCSLAKLSQTTAPRASGGIALGTHWSRRSTGHIRRATLAPDGRKFFMSSSGRMIHSCDCVPITKRQDDAGRLGRGGVSAASSSSIAYWVAPLHVDEDRNLRLGHTYVGPMPFYWPAHHPAVGTIRNQPPEPTAHPAPGPIDSHGHLGLRVAGSLPRSSVWYQNRYQTGDFERSDPPCS